MNNIRYMLLAAALLAVGAEAAAQTRQTVVFAERDSALRLDIWKPAEPRPDSACVVALFGGGFVGGARDNELQTEIARLLTARGYVVVSPDYRLGLRDSAMVARYGGLGGATKLFRWVIDLAAEDCAAAVAWVVAHAAELGVSPRRMVLTGSSAGAITVLQTDWCRANGLPQASALPAGWKPAAVVPYAGAVMCKGKPRWVTPPAPTMLMHGKKDKIVAYRRFPPLVSHALYGSATVSRRMRRQGYAVWTVRFDGVGHEVASWLPQSVELFCGFVEQALAGRVTTLDATMSDTRLQPTEWTRMTVLDLYR